MMRGKQPYEDLWKILPSRWNSRCKGTGVGIGSEGRKMGSPARLQHRSRRKQEMQESHISSEAKDPQPQKFDFQVLCSLLPEPPLFRRGVSRHREPICTRSRLSLQGWKMFFELLQYLKYHVTYLVSAFCSSENNKMQVWS